MKKIAILSGWTWYEREIALKSVEFFKQYVTYEYDFFIFPEQMNEFLQQKEKYFFAIPVFHGEYGEDGKIFAFLDILWIPSIFSSHDVHALCLDKFKTNIVLKEIWVNIPRQYLYEWFIQDWEFPLIVKPNHGGSSFYTFKVQNNEELQNAISEIQNHTADQVLIQECILWMEVSVPVINGEVLPIMSLEKQNPELFFDFKSKYEDASLIQEVFGKIDSITEKKLQEMSRKIFQFLWCKDIVRIDYIVKNGEPFFLEVNTIPWMTNASIVPKSWRFAGRKNEELVTLLLNKNIWK